MHGLIMNEETQNNQTQTQESEKPTEITQEPEQKAQDNSSEQNWARVRAVLNAQKSKIDELERQVQVSNKKPEPDEFGDVDGDDYATVNMIKKPSKKVKELETRVEQLQQKLQVNEASRQEENMRSKNDDYDYVIENFGIPLIEKTPALKQTLVTCPNWAEMAYNMAKATPEYKKAQSQDNSKKVEKVIKNTERPMSANAAGASLKSQAEVFANLSPSDVWKKSQEYARRA